MDVDLVYCVGVNSPGEKQMTSQKAVTVLLKDDEEGGDFGLDDSLCVSFHFGSCQSCGILNLDSAPLRAPTSSFTVS